MEYDIEPDIGHSREDMFKNLYRNAVITVKRYGVKVRHPFTQALARAVDAKLSEKLTKTDYVIMGSEIIPVESQIPQGYLYMGDNPHYQLIQQIVGQEKKITESALMRVYLESERYLPNTESGRKYFMELLKKMHSYGYLLVEIEKQGKDMIRWLKPGRAVRTKNKRIMIAKPGYDPIVVKLWDFLRDSPESVTFDNIRNYIINRIGWLETLDELKRYLNYMISKGYVVEEYGYYRANKPIIPFRKEEKRRWKFPILGKKF